MRRDSSPRHWNAAHADSSSARQPLRLRSCGGASLARQSGPASRSTTSSAGSSLRRAASTQPALPPPTTTQSASILVVSTPVLELKLTLHSDCTPTASGGWAGSSRTTGSV